MKMGTTQIEQILEERESKIRHDAMARAEEFAKREFELFKFELFYSSQSSEKKQKEIVDFVKRERSEAWEKAMKKSNGDFEKALSIFRDSY